MPRRARPRTRWSAAALEGWHFGMDATTNQPLGATVHGPRAALRFLLPASPTAFVEVRRATRHVVDRHRAQRFAPIPGWRRNPDRGAGRVVFRRYRVVVSLPRSHNRLRSF
jgi:hypothetical protein